jgi:hypothetical protein
MFDEFITDTLTMHKADGRIFAEIRACVTGSEIVIEDICLPNSMQVRSGCFWSGPAEL